MTPEEVAGLRPGDTISHVYQGEAQVMDNITLALSLGCNQVEWHVRVRLKSGTATWAIPRLREWSFGHHPINTRLVGIEI